VEIKAKYLKWWEEQISKLITTSAQHMQFLRVQEPRSRQDAGQGAGRIFPLILL
jgi:hypothetical protein